MTGALYYTALISMQLNFLPTVVVFQGEKPVYVRERDSGMYDIWVYATTKMIAEMPIMLAVPMIMNFLTYWFIGYTNSFSQFM